MSSWSCISVPSGLTMRTLMLLPVALAVLEGAEARERLSVPLLLGLAYAASVGGVGTPMSPGMRSPSSSRRRS